MLKRQKGRNAKRQKAKALWLEKNYQNRQAGWRKVEIRGRWWERRRAEESAEAFGYEWLSAVAR